MKMRVALLTPHFADGDGTSTVTLFLRSVLLNHGSCDVDVFSLATDGGDTGSRRLGEPRTWLRAPRISKLVWQNISYRQVGCNFGELEFQRYCPRKPFTKVLADYDLVQVVAGVPSWALVARDCERPVFLQVATRARWERGHGAAQFGLNSCWRKGMIFVTSQMEEHALEMCNRVFVENNRMQRYVAGLIAPEKVVYAPPGVDTDYFRPAAYRPNGYILSVGRFSDHRKNVRLLLDAYCRLIQMMPGAPRLVLAGSPPDEQTIATMRATRLEGRVTICTRVSRERLLELYQGASCYVLSSNEEGFGLALVEAMACGLPVISTRCGGPEQTVVHGENGFLVPIRDANSMAEALLSLLQNQRERERMGASARLWVESRFSYQCAAVPYLSQYEEIFNRRRDTAGALRSTQVIKCS